MLEFARDFFAFIFPLMVGLVCLMFCPARMPGEPIDQWLRRVWHERHWMIFGIGAAVVWFAVALFTIGGIEL